VSNRVKWEGVMGKAKKKPAAKKYIRSGVVIPVKPAARECRDADTGLPINGPAPPVLSANVGVPEPKPFAGSGFDYAPNFDRAPGGAGDSVPNAGGAP
jgi:hypothetical protein